MTLEICIHGYILQTCPSCKRNPKEWWMPYAEPIPTWIPLSLDELAYRMALGRLKARPISNQLKETGERYWLGAMIGAESNIGIYYHPRLKAYHPRTLIRMAEKPDPQRMAKLTGVTSYPYKYKGKTLQGWSIHGLRMITTSRIILPTLTPNTKRKKALQYIIEKGWKLDKNTYNQFRTKFHARKLKSLIPLNEATQLQEITWIAIGKIEEQ